MVDGNRVWHRLQELAKHTATPGPGVTRLSFTAEDTRARRQIVAWMRLSGLKVWGDEWGNLYGMLGDGGGDGVVMVGSHIDSVPGEAPSMACWAWWQDWNVWMPWVITRNNYGVR